MICEFIRTAWKEATMVANDNLLYRGSIPSLPTSPDPQSSYQVKRNALWITTITYPNLA